MSNEEHPYGTTPPLSEFEKAIGIRQGFIAEYRHGDDWSFVIKSHALLEAGVSQLLAYHLGHPPLVDVFSRLDMAASGFGKLEFVKALGLLDDSERKFVRTLGELRNMLVHNIANVDFDLRAYMGSLEKQKLNATQLALDRLFDGDPHAPLPDDRDLTPRKVFLASPKAIIAGGVKLILLVVHNRTVLAKKAALSRAVYGGELRDALLERLRTKDGQD
jgi:hypothetical protein